MITTKKKLIEVALPLDKINAASADEQSSRQGHPSTLHLWWSRKPMATARAVILAQMVDDPSSHPELFPTEEAQEVERQRLFRLIERLVEWENTTNEDLLQQARDEIWKSWHRTCAENKDHPRAAELFNPDTLPAFHDPFAGGGSIPFEAQRLGLESYASDLNPVAVLINKAMIELPRRFLGWPPVNPKARTGHMILAQQWRGMQGLAEDVRYYGQWMRDEAEKRIGHLYPKIEVTAEMARERPDLKPYVGKKLTVTTWLWARTVKSPNPAFRHVDVPLASTFMLSTKPGKEIYVQPVIEGDHYQFVVKVGTPKDVEAVKNGTKLARGANFFCLVSQIPIAPEYIKAEGKAGRLGARLMAIVAESVHNRVYLTPTPEQERIAQAAQPAWSPEGELVEDARAFTPILYGLTAWSDLFTDRQLVALTTLSDLVQETHEHIQRDVLAVKMPSDSASVSETEARAYADAVALYLACGMSKVSNMCSAMATWKSGGGGLRGTFARQAIAMTWEFAEANPFAESGGSFGATIDKSASAIAAFPENAREGYVYQADAVSQRIASYKVVSTDPPYYDNIQYADLSDFFYVWLRKSLKPIFPELLATFAVPKAEELVACAYRHNGKAGAERFFLEGMTQALRRLAEQTHPAFPVTIYYAFKQTESADGKGVSSTAWETFLDALLRAGFALTGTWPMRTEGAARMRAQGSNAIASSIVLVCRPQPHDAPTGTRRNFLDALKADLPIALAHLQHGSIAPVDLAQATIGLGMAIFTRYKAVLNAAGKSMTVHEALISINETLDELLTEQESDFDVDTRWALAWFEQYGFDEGEFGVAETLSKAKNTSIGGLMQAGVIASRGGKVRLLRPDELPVDWDPIRDNRLTTWELVHHLIRALEEGELSAAQLMGKARIHADVVRELAYRLYSLCERKKRAAEALLYNGLVQSWPELMRLTHEEPGTRVQNQLL
jgi:putative DNA methylase